ncbi:hypothetical protein HQN90_25015 [Paenibacillus alba]|uniref:polymorphic toxin type 44 domain-containing protein n=1 Tax=Paenibacillus alba TaxID=1197127 RepID=UPI0015663033|nr:polymorphic toxin type 44 domain-containing protein [Paenibacillus alba]NQX69402.1 hypothetical protein [Paenibacillus alba]
MLNRKKILSLLVTLVLFGSLSNTAFASVIQITSEFSLKMRQNAAYMAYYALNDAQQGTYPIGTGQEFASKVPSGGPWDYKKDYKNADGYGFGGNWMRGEDIGNMHYGYVGPMNKYLLMLSENECCSERLVSIAARHIKLALEYLNRKTSIERKQTNLSEIAKLREERDALINQAVCIDNNKN